VSTGQPGKSLRTTARFHFDALVAAGLSDRANEARELSGRPRALYTARADSPPSGRRSYRLHSIVTVSRPQASVTIPE
jgi:predicted ArsR family transcriptional regulator